MGRVLLAALPEEEAMARLKASNPEALTRHTVTEMDALRQKLAQMRKQGWCLVNQELEEGLCPWPHRFMTGPDAPWRHSTSAARPTARVMQDNMLQPLLQAAQTISRLLAVQNKA
jgi:IclR family pca regulon transcriptional regulator